MLFEKFSVQKVFMDEIRCDEPSYLIWKWHPKGSRPGESNRENAIRWGSSLRVKDGEVAVFVYNQKNGIMQDYIAGPFDQILSTENLPILANIIGLAYNGGTPFQAEVYFINLAQIIQVKFGVPFFDVFDPRFSDFSVPVAVRGTISFQIADCAAFIKMHRLNTFSLEDFQRQIRDAVCRYVKDTVSNAPAVHNIPVIQLESRIAQINDVIEYDLAERLKESFGVWVSGIDIGAIEIDKASEGYAQLMSITRNITAAETRAQAAANIQNIQDKQRIDSANYEETLRAQREEAQYAQRMQTRTANFAAYQVEKQAEVGVAGANAFGQMNSNGAGNLNIGESAGFNPTAVMAGMAMGSTIGQNMANIMNTAMSGTNQPIAPGNVPPPIPTITYHVAINGQAAGPYDLETLKQMVCANALTKDSLVWKPGMTNWTAAGTVDELKSVFVNDIPPIPPQR